MIKEDLMLQAYSRFQFTSLPTERQAHAYKMFLDLDLETLSLVIRRELETQSEVEELFSEDHDDDDHYGEYEQLKLNNSNDVGDDEHEFQITSNQLQQIKEEVAVIESSTETFFDDNFDDKDNASEKEDDFILQLSPEHLEQIQQEIQILENNLLEDISDGDVDEEIEENLTTLEPRSTATTTSEPITTTTVGVIDVFEDEFESTTTHTSTLQTMELSKY